MRRSGLRVALTLAVLLAGSSASAQNEANKGQARELGEKGFAALDRQDWAQAETLFLQAESLYHAPTLLLGVARAQSHLGKYIESWEAYHRIILEGAPPGANPVLLKAVDDAKSEIDGVAGKRSKITLTVTGADGPKVTLDGAVIPNAALGVERPINPGKHTVHAEAAGVKPGDGTFSVDEGKATTFSLALEKDAGGAPPPGDVTPPGQPPPPAGADVGTSGGSMNRTLAFVSFGVGAVGLVTGVVTGIMALGQHSDLQSNPCSTKPCNATDGSAFNSDLDSYHTISTVSTIGFIVGLVGGAGGAVLLLTAPKKEAQTGSFITPTVGLGTVGAAGRF